MPIERLPEVVIAYEPVWAIGTGPDRDARAGAGRVAASCARSSRASTRPPARPVRILYGGSLKPDNAEELLALPDIDGALVGGASLDPDDFAAIVQTARGWSPRHEHGPLRLPRRPRRLGAGAGGPGQRGLAGGHAGVRPHLGEHPHTQLTACGEAVGLPAGQMGNSEVGHLNLGAGAIVPQDLARIDKAVEDGTLGDNEMLQELMDGAERVHLIGLVSDGGVHSSDRHLKALIELAAEGVPDVVVHAFTDGRDTSPKGGAKFLAEVEALEAARASAR